ncbi:MAG: helix-turn-helix transcriptional regulator [Firmicutes bacterium]|nr:helix-turn-helix transcriptional regulator [Bacillota bacterium]
MANWNNYKESVKRNSPELAQDIREIEILSSIIGAMIDQRHQLNLSQRDLARLCDIPQSSVARIESGSSVPNLSTLLKMFDQLGLTLTVQAR